MVPLPEASPTPRRARRGQSDAPVSVVTGATGGIGRWIARGPGPGRPSRGPGGAGRRPGSLRHSPGLPQAVPHASDRGRCAPICRCWPRRAAPPRRSWRCIPRLAVLVNNAGMFAARAESHGRGSRPVAGHQSSLAVPAQPGCCCRRCGQAAPARIVHVGSSSADRIGLDPGSGSRPGIALGDGWRLCPLQARIDHGGCLSWRTRLAGTGVAVNVVHPGLVATDIVRSGWADRAGLAHHRAFRVDPGTGCDHAAARRTRPGIRQHSPAATSKSCRAVPPNPRAQDPALRRLGVAGGGAPGRSNLTARRRNSRDSPELAAPAPRPAAERAMHREHPAGRVRTMSAPAAPPPAGSRVICPSMPSRPMHQATRPGMMPAGPAEHHDSPRLIAHLAAPGPCAACQMASAITSG